MASSRTGSGLGMSLLLTIMWLIHWFVTDVPRDSPCDLFDGIVHGLSINLNGVRRAFGADVGMRDYFAPLGYEIGLAIGVSLWLTLYNAIADVTLDELVGVRSREGVPRLGIAIGLAVLGLGVGLVFADYPSPPPTAPEDIPPLMGFIPGWLWQGFATVMANVTTAIMLLLLGATAFSLLGRGR